MTPRGALLLSLALALPAAPAGAGAMPPRLLSDTGLYEEGAARLVRPEHLPFTPQYPLWSDGTTKRRWISLPPGAFIDARDPDAWDFPVGTKLWKEFAHGRPIETRYIERGADGWHFATYVWNADGTEARLAPARGAVVAAAGAPGGRYEVPGQDDCRACHDGGRVPVLGFSALQLSPARDPLAPHGAPLGADDVDLRRLAERGLLRNLPPAQLARPPRIPAFSPVARAALGYLHGNCGHCHNDSDAAPPVGLRLQQDGSAASLAGAWRSLTQDRGRALVVPGAAAASVLPARMHSRQPATQMPPLGTRLPDPVGLALVERWINSLEPTQEKHR